MLSTLHLGDGNNIGNANGQIALDCSVRKTKQGHYVISTTDFFFPLVESPYLQGRIGAANVLSDLYATGVADCDFMLMLLAASRDMIPEHRSICTREMVRGFRAACQQAHTPITGGQTVLNPWPVIGGVATAVVTSTHDFCPLNQAQAGHVVVLTKPLGTQVAVNVHQWRRRFEKSVVAAQATTTAASNNSNGDNDEDGKDDDHKKKAKMLYSNDVRLWTKCVEKTNMTVEQAERMMDQAVCSMARLNRTAAQIMSSTSTTTTTTTTTSSTEAEATTEAEAATAKRYPCSACTDVTGFGILGHAQNLADNQIANVAIVLDTLPCIAGTIQVNDDVLDFRLRAGYSAETSGGLLLCLPSREMAEQFCRELQEKDGHASWIVGRVVERETRKCEIVDAVEIIEV